MPTAKIMATLSTEAQVADALREAAGLASPRQYPSPGDIVEVTKNEAPFHTGLGICIEYRKGCCVVKTFDDDGDLAKSLDFVTDEERHGPCRAEWRIRDDLRGP